MAMAKATKEQRQKWTVRRWRELKQLERLLMECEKIDSANNTIDRLKRLITEAKKLRREGFRRGSPSFLRFLEEQAASDIRPRKPKTAGSELTDG